MTERSFKFSAEPTYRNGTVVLKAEKWAFVLPDTAKTNKQRQGLDLYGSFLQIAHDLRRQQVCTLTGHVTFSFKPAFFIRERNCR